MAKREGGAPLSAAPAGVGVGDPAFLKKLEYLHVVARKVFAGRMRADRRSRKTGAGVEFADHRDYAPGDDLRYLDWSVYGRMDRLLLRLFEQEEDLYIYLLVDASASMRGSGGAKLAYAAQVAAALAYIGLANLDRVSILTFAQGLRDRLPAARGKGQIFKVLEFLRGLTPQGETGLNESLTSFVHQTSRRGLAVVISDFYDPAGYEEALNLLRYHRFEPSVIQVIDRREAHPALRGDVELFDVETGDVREVTLSPRLCEDFARAHEAYCEGLSGFCAGRGIGYFRAETQIPFEDLVLRIFRSGGFLR